MAAMTDAALYDLVQRTFGDLGPGVVNGMFAIAKRESGGDPGAVNQNAATRDDSHGLWQINVRPDANPQFASWDLSNPEVNAKAARILYDQAGPTPWSTYNAASDAALFGGTAADYAGTAGAQAAGYNSSGGLSGATPGSRPLINMSSVNAPAAALKADAAPAVQQPLPEPDWSKLGTLIRAAGGKNPFASSNPLIPAGMSGDAASAGTPAPLVPSASNLSAPTPAAGSAPLVPPPVIMGPNDWRKLLAQTGTGA